MIASKKADHYQIRLPPGLRERLAKRADKNGRSMNTEIIAAIEQHLRRENRFTLVASAVVELSGLVHDLATNAPIDVLADIRQQAAALETRLAESSLCDPP